MLDVKKLFSSINPLCDGCSALKKPLPEHSVMDYEGKGQVDILFVSDSLKMYEGDYVAFRPQEFKLILNELKRFGITNEKIGFTASVKCPNLKDYDLTSKDKKVCRVHIKNTIRQYKPKLVFACGKLATTMLFGKNIDSNKGRGKVVEMEIDIGEDNHKYKVVPISHPWQVISEPKNAFLFSIDIEDALNSIIFCKEKVTKFNYIEIHSIEDLIRESADFIDTALPISIDIETTGLNFLEDIINTIAITLFDPNTIEPIKTIAMPLEHKDSMSYGLHFRAKVCEIVEKILANKNNRKVLQNCKFDLKFLARYGIKDVHNIWDTKLMFHMLNEEVPKSLSDLVQYFYPGEI